LPPPFGRVEAVFSNQEQKMKLRPTFNTDELNILRDAMAIYVAMVTEEYHQKPSLEKAKKMDSVVNLNDKLKGRG
jgi:hypothetical protein